MSVEAGSKGRSYAVRKASVGSDVQLSSDSELEHWSSGVAVGSRAGELRPDEAIMSTHMVDETTVAALRARRVLLRRLFARNPSESHPEPQSGHSGDSPAKAAGIDEAGPQRLQTSLSSQAAPSTCGAWLCGREARVHLLRNGTSKRGTAQR